MVWSPDGAKIVAGSGSRGEGKVWIFDSTSGALIGSPLKVDNSVGSIAYSPDGSKLAAAHYKTVSIFNMETNEVLCTVNVDAGVTGVRSISFSPKGDMVAAGCHNGNIFFVDAAAGEIKSSLTWHTR